MTLGRHIDVLHHPRDAVSLGFILKAEVGSWWCKQSHTPSDLNDDGGRVWLGPSMGPSRKLGPQQRSRRPHGTMGRGDDEGACLHCSDGSRTHPPSGRAHPAGWVAPRRISFDPRPGESPWPRPCEACLVYQAEARHLDAPERRRGRSTALQQSSGGDGPCLGLGTGLTGEEDPSQDRPGTHERCAPVGGAESRDSGFESRHRSMSAMVLSAIAPRSWGPVDARVEEKSCAPPVRERADRVKSPGTCRRHPGQLRPLVGLIGPRCSLPSSGDTAAKTGRPREGTEPRSGGKPGAHRRRGAP